MLWLLACTADLLPGEVIVGVDVPATRWDGAANERFGAVVAGDVNGGYAAAPGVPVERALLSGGVVDDGVTASWVGVGGGHVYASSADGTWWLDGVAQPPVADAVAWAASDTGLVVATKEGWTMPLAGVSVAQRGITSMEIGDRGVLAVVCTPDCEVDAWAVDGVGMGIRLTVGVGGAVGEWAGMGWAGDPQDDVDDGAGKVCNEIGNCIFGQTGDHLGRTIGGGFAAGTFNKWIVPARARFVPLMFGESGAGTVLSLESGAENQALAVAGDDEAVYLGAPYYEEDGQPGGAVFAVARP